VEKIVFGTSAKGLDIEMFIITKGPLKVLIMGGVHGDEPEGFTFAENFLRRGNWKQFEGRLALYVVPRMNPDACLAGTRINANGVDLNRNMPTKDWTAKAANDRYIPGPAPASEPETKALMKLVNEEKFDAILSFHSYDPMINYNGPSKELAQVISEKCGYKIADDMGYPTPGSFGTWAGSEKGIPTITYEIQREMDHEASWLLHGPAVIAGLEYLAGPLKSAENSNV
jgi:protein MpaA